MNSNWSYSPETPNLGQNLWFLVPCDLDIWGMTFKNIRAPLLCRFKLCASFHCHMWIQIGVTVRKRPIWVKTTIFFFQLSDLHIWHMTLKNNSINKLCASFHHHMWIQTASYSPETAKLGLDLCDLDLCLLTLTFCMDITSVNGNNSWYDDRNIVKNVWGTDGRRDRKTDRRKEVFLELLGRS